MTPSPILSDVPQKYPQNLHTPKNIHFSETPNQWILPINNEIQNFDPKNDPRPRILVL